MAAPNYPATPGGDHPRTPSRRAWLAGAAALPALVAASVSSSATPPHAGAAALPALSTVGSSCHGGNNPVSEVAAAHAAYMPYDDPSVTDGMTDEACDAWNDRQSEAAQRLAEAKARSLADLTLKLTTALGWFEYLRCEDNLGAAESDLLRSCLRDLLTLKGEQV